MKSLPIQLSGYEVILRWTVMGIVMKIFAYPGTLLLVTLLAACNGGGGSQSCTNPAAPDSIFSLGKFNTIVQGSKYAFTLDGSDNQGGKYSGSFSAEVKAKTTYNNQQVTPVESLLILQNDGTGASVSAFDTIYLGDDKEPVGEVSQSNGATIIYTPTEIHILPDSAHIGDFGLLTSWSGNDGSSETSNWALKAACENAQLVVTTSYSGNVSGTQTTSVTLDPGGNPLSVHIELSYPDQGVTVDLTGTPTT